MCLLGPRVVLRPTQGGPCSGVIGTSGKMMPCLLAGWLSKARRMSVYVECFQQPPLSAWCRALLGVAS